MARKHQTVYEYTVVFEPAEEGGYVVDVPALPGCHTQGDTLEEAKKNALEAIQCYLEGLAKENKPIPKERKGMVSKLRVPLKV